MNSASRDVENGISAMVARNASWSHVRSRSALANKFSSGCWPFQKIPSVRKLRR
jgi:hypothetical protein